MTDIYAPIDIFHQYKTAERRGLFWAKLLGCRVIGVDSGIEMTGYWFRSHLYVTSVRIIKETN